MKPSLKSFVFFFFILPILGNLPNIFWAFAISPMIFSEEINKAYMARFNSMYHIHIILILVLCLLFFAYYLKDILKEVYHQKELSIPSKNKILDIPIVMSTTIFIAWLIAGLVGDSIFYWNANIELNTRLMGYGKGILFNLSNSSFSFVLYYYVLEFINKKYFIPAYFPDNKLSNYKSIYVMTIMKRFRILFFAISFYPLFLISLGVIRLYCLTDDSQILSIAKSIFIIISFTIFSGGMLTYIIAKLYQIPLVTMKDATETICQNSFDINIPITSKDEIGILGESINKMAIELKEKELIKDTFGKMVDPNVRDYLLNTNINLGGELKELTILFSDIRSFTTLSENMEPQRVVELLNKYFDAMGSIISKEGGLVNKFIGDSIMAIFGAPITLENHAGSAVSAAIKMRTELQKLNSSLLQEGFPEIKAGIGIHSGIVLAGNIGSHSRMEYTVIGDSVNIASRIESMCKEFKTDLLASESTVALLEPAKYKTELIDSVILKGKTKPISIYKVIHITQT